MNRNSNQQEIICMDLLAYNQYVIKNYAQPVIYLRFILGQMLELLALNWQENTCTVLLLNENAYVG